jgi:adenylate kinase
VDRGFRQRASATHAAREKNVKALVLFGSPGSGKGTQAQMLKQGLGIPHISTGDMLRDGIRRGTAMGLAVQSTMQAGSLVPDEVVNELVE